MHFQTGIHSLKGELPWAMGGAIDQMGQRERGLSRVLGSSPASWEVSRSYPSTCNPTLYHAAEGPSTGHMAPGFGFGKGWEGKSRPHPILPSSILTLHLKIWRVTAQPIWPSPGLPLFYNLLEG